MASIDDESTGAPVRAGDLLAGKYRVEKVLGVGAMGVVVAAMHEDLHERRALKFMLPSAVGGPDAAERFLREARAAVRLRSEHVTKVHDVGRLENGAPYIVMEYLEGTDMKRLLDERGTIPVADAKTYMLQACEAIAEAHAAGIVHRDLKPANLFITRNAAGGPCVKVLDFGIAKVKVAENLDITRTTDLLGTPLYMSPEQMRSTRSVDARTDVWALGVILYRMLVGRTPFAGATVAEICSAVAADDPDPPSSVRADLPDGLEAVVLRCLQKSAAARYADAGELGAALRAIETERRGARELGSTTVDPELQRQAARSLAAQREVSLAAAAPVAPVSVARAPVAPVLAAPAPVAPMAVAQGHGEGQGSTTGQSGSWSQTAAPAPAPSRAPLAIGVVLGLAVVAVAGFFLARAGRSGDEGIAAPVPTESAVVAPRPAAIESAAPSPTPEMPATSAPAAAPAAPSASPPAAAPPRASASAATPPAAPPPRPPPRRKDAFGNERK